MHGVIGHHVCLGHQLPMNPSRWRMKARISKRIAMMKPFLAMSQFFVLFAISTPRCALCIHFIILSKSCRDNEDIACWAFAASSSDGFIPNGSPMFASISGLIFFIMDSSICHIAGSSMKFLMTSCISVVEGGEANGGWSILWSVSSGFSTTFCGDEGWKSSSSTISSITTPFCRFAPPPSIASFSSASLITSAIVSSSGEISWALLRSATAASR